MIRGADVFKENREVWDKIYQSGNSVLEYPNENLVVIAHHLFKENHGKKLLDLGFGSGNNLIHLLRKGFDCYGCEISPISIELTKARLDALRLLADLKIFKDSIPYPDKFFDVLISWQALYYNDFDGVKFMINEVFRVLKPHGQFIITLVKDNDVITKVSDKIGEKTYRVNSQLPSQEGAIVFIPETKEDVKELFSDFSRTEIGYFESEYLGRTSSHWVIWGKK